VVCKEYIKVEDEAINKMEMDKQSLPPPHQPPKGKL